MLKDGQALAVVEPAVLVLVALVVLPQQVMAAVAVHMTFLVHGSGMLVVAEVAVTAVNEPAMDMPVAVAELDRLHSMPITVIQHNQ